MNTAAKQSAEKSCTRRQSRGSGGGVRWSRLVGVLFCSLIEGFAACYSDPRDLLAVSGCNSFVDFHKRAKVEIFAYFYLFFLLLLRCPFTSTSVVARSLVLSLEHTAEGVSAWKWFSRLLVILPAFFCLRKTRDERAKLFFVLFRGIFFCASFAYLAIPIIFGAFVFGAEKVALSTIITTASPQMIAAKRNGGKGNCGGIRTNGNRKQIYLRSAICTSDLLKQIFRQSQTVCSNPSSKIELNKK